MSILAAVQGVGGLVLGGFTWASIGDASGSLTTPRLWSLMLMIGSVLALGLIRHHTKTSWALAGATLSTAMLGRGIDILANLDEFVGRPGLAVAVWITMGASTFAAWVAVGAMAGWEPADG